jgi:hypothetical protein
VAPDPEGVLEHACFAEHETCRLGLKRASWAQGIERRIAPPDPAPVAGRRNRRCDREIRKEADMRKYIIEREIPGAGTLEREQLKEAAARSNAALAQLAPDIQWVESYVADNKTFCVYLAKDEALIRRHAELSGFPANKITRVNRTIDPTTAT